MNPVFPVDYLVPALLVIFVAGLYAAWRSARLAATPLRIGLVGLRGAALSLCAVIALNPGTWNVPAAEEDSEWAILVDRSASMQFDAVNRETRWGQAIRLARESRSRDEQPERVRLHTFSAELDPRRDTLGDLEREAPDGESTDIRKALNQLLDEYERSRRPLDGVLLLSDGRQIGSATGPDPALRARARGAPIYAVALGGDVERRDLSVTPVRRHFIGFAGQSVRLQARIRNEQLGDIRPEIVLRDAAGETIRTRAVPVPDNGEIIAEFEVRRDEAGYMEYEIVAPDWPGEVSAANNRIRVASTMLAERIRVLLVEGVPHWDSKFLLQLLRAQPHMQVTTVHRVTGDRFFLTETDEMDEADERDVFPSEAAELNAYDVVIFGKGAEYFLNSQRVRLLRHFVEERGGSVLFARGKPYSGTFNEMEPLEPVEWGGLVRRPFQWRPTAAADASGLFGPLLPDRHDERWNRIPTAQLAHRPQRLKPFTQILIEGVFIDGPAEATLPVLSTRRIGKGLSVVINAEDIWRWDFFPQHEAASEMYKQFWTLLVQWMAIQSDFLPGRSLSLQLSHAATDPGGAVKATVRMRQTGEESVQPILRIRQGDTELRTARPRAVVEGKPEWTTVFSLDAPGIYRVETLVEDRSDQDATYATLEIREPPHEMMDVSADPEFLERLTTRSGGRTLSEEELAAWSERFRPEQHAAEIADPVWHTRWDRAWIALLLTALFSADWFLRRRNGMM